jgi:hypothetical protein
MNATANDGAALPHARSACGINSPAGAKMIAASRCSGGMAFESRPKRLHSFRELLPGCIARPGKGENTTPLVARHLCHDLRRRTKTINAKSLWRARPYKRPIANEPGTKLRAASASE